MANELETMREIRTKQQNIRISLKKREEQNKELRSKITAIWTDPCKEYEVYQLSKELTKGRAKTKNYQKLLREFKVNLKETNRSYDLNAKGYLNKTGEFKVVQEIKENYSEPKL